MSNDKEKLTYTFSEEGLDYWDRVMFEAMAMKQSGKDKDIAYGRSSFISDAMLVEWDNAGLLGRDCQRKIEYAIREAEETGEEIDPQELLKPIMESYFK